MTSLKLIAIGLFSACLMSGSGLILSTPSVKAAPSGNTGKWLECLKTWQEFAKTDHKKAKNLIKDGPEKVLSGLKAADRKVIKTYLASTETLKFRCHSFTPPPVPNPKR